MPPFLDDGEVEQRVVAWLRALPRNASASEPPPKRPRVQQALSFVGPNAVDVVQSVRQTTSPSARATAHPAAAAPRLRPGAGAFADADRVRDGVPVTWTEVENFRLVRRAGERLMLDRALGLVTVGDGLQGRVIPDGARVVAAMYSYGGGLAGNLPAGRAAAPGGGAGDDVSPLDPGKTLNPVPTAGGSETETVDQARRRVPMILRHQDRAVTADDFRELANRTPGVAVGPRRGAAALPAGRAGAQKFPGVVSVLVVPSEDPLHPRAPEPGRQFPSRGVQAPRPAPADYHRALRDRTQVCAHRRLRRHPRQERLCHRDAHQLDLSRAAPVLRARCRPSVPTGRDGPGRTHQPCAIEAAVLQVEGCAWVEELQPPAGAAAGYGEAVEQLLLSVTDLPELAQIDVDLGKSPPPKPQSPIGNQIPVPVPAPRTTC